MKKGRKKFNYIDLCESRGELLEGKIGNTLLIIDCLGFNHEMDVASIRRGASLSIRSVVESQKSEYYVKVLKNKWGDEISHFDFNNFDYKSVFEDALVTCTFHGSFMVKPSNILKSKFVCKGCLSDHLTGVMAFDTKSFIEKCKKVHGDKYDYGKTKYTGNRNYVTVTCPKHGDFQVLARTHSSDSQACGCIKCKSYGGGGYSRGEYKALCPDGSNVYVMKMYSEEEEYIKIGISKSVKSRANTFRRITGCEVEVLHTEFFTNSEAAWDTEVMLHREFKDSKIRTEVRFKGESECFDLSIKDEVIKLLKCVA